MGTKTNISWCDHTFNYVRGCDKVSAGCDNCYAETMSHRNPAVLGEWGPDGTRALASEDYWRLPFKWNRLAAAEGRRHRVFSLSLGDWLEDRPELIAPRARLLATIRLTHNLDWLLLTKRPEGWADRMREVVEYLHDDGHSYGSGMIARSWLAGRAPANVWFGISTENQEMFDERWKHAQHILAMVHFFSVEPMLGPIVLPHIDTDYTAWVITGGESGAGARPMIPDWPRSLRDQCRAQGIAYFHKQNGEYAEWDGSQSPSPSWRSADGKTAMVRVGKHAAGHLLDRREHHEFPMPGQQALLLEV